MLVVGVVGIGLIGSGLFVTDPVGASSPLTADHESSDDAGQRGTALTGSGKLHNICAVPIFAGIPVAGLVSAVAAARNRDYRWACYSAGSSLLMVGSFLLFGKAFDTTSGLAGTGGVYQRLSVLLGFGWLTALSLRALSSLRRG